MVIGSADAGDVRLRGIEDEMKSSYLDYAMSVIVQRALPDVRDGLKPVHRRILYAMHDLGMRPNSAYKKSARLVGDVLGKYHPHGDAPVYEALVRMAQPFSLRYMLIDGQGNFGSVDGDPPAAMRYTECRLAQISETMLEDMDRETVDWYDNFDGSLQQPTVLPARLPNLLANGASGIAVGMATNIPPHNLTELCDGIVKLLERPDSTVEDLMEVIKGPDFPTGAHIWGKQGIRDAFNTGRGRIVVQANHEIEEMGKLERKRLVFNEIPFQVNKSTLVARIAELVKTRKVEGISEVRDESDRKGMRIVVELKKGASPEVILNNLYKHTALRSSFSVNMLALVHGTPKVLNLKDALKHYIEFREEVVRRRAEFDLKKARARVHILEGLRIALHNLDRVIQIIRASKDVETARTNLMAEFKLSEIQAQAILDMQLRRLAALEQEKIENEYKELMALIADLEALLASPERVRRMIRQETLELKRRFGDERRTVVHNEELGDWDPEDLIPHQEVVITLSKNNYVKRVAATTFRAQHRGGKGVKGQRMTKEDDVTPYMQVADTRDHLLFFTNKGRVFDKKVWRIEEQTRGARGTPLSVLLDLEPRETAHAILAVASLTEDVYLVFVTRRGKVKRMHLPLLRNLRASGLNAMRLDPGDELVTVVPARPDQDVVIVTEKGLSIRFASPVVRPRLRNAGGVRGIALTEKDRVVQAAVVTDDDYLLIVGRKGYGKLSQMRNYRQQGRGGKGIITLKVTDKTGPVAAAAVVSESLRADPEGKLFLLTEKAFVQLVPLNEVRQTGRNAQGVKIMPPESGDAISAIRVLGERRTPAEQLTEAALAAAEAEAAAAGDAEDEELVVNAEVEDDQVEDGPEEEAEDEPEVRKAKAPKAVAKPNPAPKPVKKGRK